MFYREGVVMVDGSWKTIRVGQACLLPPFVMNSLKCTGEKRWRFAWVRYEESRDTIPIVSSVSPVIGSFDGGGLAAAITGLHAESTRESNPARDWTLEDLAEIACLSTEHMRHLTFIRLQRAVRLLSSTDDKIETVARAVGFSSIHSFSNSFKARFGRPPSDFR